MQAIKNPLAISAIGQDIADPQLRQMPGDLRLAFFQGANQVADAKLTLAADQ